MRPIFLLFTVALTISLICCAKPPVKKEVKAAPIHVSEKLDPYVKVIMDEYFKLSAHNHITFKKKVSIGLTTIERGSVIGLCTFGDDFREIDLDADFWKRSSWVSKVALVYHELNHCYCGRDHDFDDGTMYPDNSFKAMIQQWLQNIPYTPLKPAGYLEDMCPKSIMHPIVLSDECLVKHYQYYVKEMFVRCNPY